VSICVRAGLPKPRGVPDTERIKDTKTLDYASTPLDANTLLAVVVSPLFYKSDVQRCSLTVILYFTLSPLSVLVNLYFPFMYPFDGQQFGSSFFQIPKLKVISLSLNVLYSPFRITSSLSDFLEYCLYASSNWIESSPQSFVT
jgi:hypothetical protein